MYSSICHNKPSTYLIKSHTDCVSSAPILLYRITMLRPAGCSGGDDRGVMRPAGGYTLVVVCGGAAPVGAGAARAAHRSGATHAVLPTAAAMTPLPPL